MSEALQLPIVDLSSPDCISTANAIRQVVAVWICKFIVVKMLFRKLETAQPCTAFIVNIGDMMERWTNCLFRSTLHRVLPPGQERYSVAFFINPNKDCIVECLESCCSESCPPRFLPIRCLDYLEERLRLTYGS
ncbi:Oxoglutarate/iron-dependent dioxygenase - like 10 [Theobroma cacao]|nr:Oxoglutarate/iron-dependent dioxygenase - like 10 [Theobroma cacao]